MTVAERRSYELGCRSFDRGDTDEALTQLEAFARTRGNFANVHYMMGVLHDRRDDFTTAGKCLREALRINPSYVEAMLALAIVYENQGNFERACELVARAQRLGERADEGRIDATTRGKLANLQARLGDAYHEVGELREAIDAYRRALDRCPDFHDIRYRLGVVLREAGLPDRALVEFGHVLRRRPDYLDAVIQKGLTLYTLGRAEEAAADWTAVLAADPERADARMYLRMVTRRNAG